MHAFPRLVGWPVLHAAHVANVMGNKNTPTQLQPTRIIARSTQFLTRSVFEFATEGGKLCKDHLPAGRKLSEWAQYYIYFISSHNIYIIARARGFGSVESVGRGRWVLSSYHQARAPHRRRWPSCQSWERVLNLATCNADRHDGFKVFF